MHLTDKTPFFNPKTFKKIGEESLYLSKSN